MFSLNLQEKSRRDVLKLAAAGVFAPTLSGWLPLLAKAAPAGGKGKAKSCILLWMDGGPSHKDTWDLKPDSKGAGEFKPIKTAAPGVEISEHLPKVAKVMNHGVVVRGMSTPEGAHSAAITRHRWLTAAFDAAYAPLTIFGRSAATEDSSTTRDGSSAEAPFRSSGSASLAHSQVPRVLTPITRSNSSTGISAISPERSTPAQQISAFSDGATKPISANAAVTRVASATSHTTGLKRSW